MIKKLLLTLLVCAGVYLVIRFRQRRARLMFDGEIYDACPSDNRCRNAGLFLGALMLIAFAAYVLYAWWAIKPIVSVRVINPETGKEVVYLAYEDDVAERSFETLDGRRVQLGSIEHIEVKPVDKK